jgi:hypothetical protein
LIEYVAKIAAAGRRATSSGFLFIVCARELGVSRLLRNVAVMQRTAAITITNGTTFLAVQSP